MTNISSVTAIPINAYRRFCLKNSNIWKINAINFRNLQFDRTSNHKKIGGKLEEAIKI